MMTPMFLAFSFLINSMGMTPKMINKGARLVMLKEMIQAVMVVPMLAPNIMPKAWLMVMSPAFTKPTAITVTAAEAWMTAVTSIPTSTATSRLLVIFSSRFFNLFPAVLLSPFPIILMP